MAKKLSKSKAKKMLEENEAQGKPLTKRQKRFFGFIAGGGTPTRLKKRPKKKAA